MGVQIVSNMSTCKESPRLTDLEELKHEYRNRLDKVISDSHLEADREDILSYVKALFHTECGPLSGPFWNAHYIEEMFRAAVEHAKQHHHGKDKVLLTRDSLEAAVSTSNRWYSRALSKAKSKIDEAMHLDHGYHE
ncbi:hypothetical protein V8C26DRAFT_436624 [Trichoderma gracile]